MKEFNLLGDKVVFTDKECEFMEMVYASGLGEKMDELLRINSRKILDDSVEPRKKYSPKSDSKGYCESIKKLGHKYIDEAIECVLNTLFERKIYDISKEELINRGAYKKWDNIFDTFIQALNYVNQEERASKVDKVNYKNTRNTTWIGGGVGVKGAIKGAITADAMNAAGDAFQAVSNAVGNSFINTLNDILINNPAESDANIKRKKIFEELQNKDLSLALKDSYNYIRFIFTVIVWDKNNTEWLIYKYYDNDFDTYYGGDDAELDEEYYKRQISIAANLGRLTGEQRIDAIKEILKEHYLNEYTFSCIFGCVSSFENDKERIELCEYCIKNIHVRIFIYTVKLIENLEMRNKLVEELLDTVSLQCIEKEHYLELLSLMNNDKRKRKLFVECLQKNPLDKDVYNLLLKLYPSNAKEVCSIGEYVDANYEFLEFDQIKYENIVKILGEDGSTFYNKDLDELKTCEKRVKEVEEKYGLKSNKINNDLYLSMISLVIKHSKTVDMSDEKEILALRNQVAQICENYGTGNRYISDLMGDFLNSLNAKLSNLDEKARTYNNKMYATREEALEEKKKEKEIIEKKEKEAAPFLKRVDTCLQISEYGEDIKNAIDVLKEARSGKYSGPSVEAVERKIEKRIADLYQQYNAAKKEIEKITEESKDYGKGLAFWIIVFLLSVAYLHNIFGNILKIVSAIIVVGSFMSKSNDKKLLEKDRTIIEKQKMYFDIIEFDNNGKVIIKE